MARGLNAVRLLGYIGRDPDTRETANGGVVVNASLATTEQWKDRDGNKQERTEWHRLVFFAKLAEVARDFLRKGSQCYVEGRLQTRKWQDKSGADRWSTETVVGELLLLGGKGEGGEDRGERQRQGDHWGQHHQPEHGQQADMYRQASGGGARRGGAPRGTGRPSSSKLSTEPGFDDPIPF